MTMWSRLLIVTERLASLILQDLYYTENDNEDKEIYVTPNIQRRRTSFMTGEIFLPSD